ncbi:MAG: hypothetical protein Q9181_006888, partial [Wetmoreana brouardii]
MSPSSRIVIYTGAPLSKSLEWEEELLTAPLQPCFSDLSNQNIQDPSISTERGPNWRSVPLEKQLLPTGLTQATNPDFASDSPIQNESQASSPTPAEVSTLGTDAPSQSQFDQEQEDKNHDDDTISQYYEHSFAIHEDVPSSQVIPATQSPTSPSSSSFASASYVSSDANFTTLSLSASFNPQQDILNRLPLSDLTSLPTAAYLTSIHPQTMTVNLLVGVIQLPHPRLIITRRHARTVELVEMSVGDDTAAGFGVNIWLPHHPDRQHISNSSAQLETAIEALRIQDLVLMQNVALTSFRGKVYGQSLRRGMTRVELVYRVHATGGEEERAEMFGPRELERGEGRGVEKVRR